MYIKNIRVVDFKSMYGEHTFDFDNLKGLVKLSGAVGSGKTTLGEAILFGLYGSVKGQTHSELASWGTAKSKTMTIDINLISSNHEIFIHRNPSEPLDVKIDGKPLISSNKRDAQEILETEYYDVPRLAVERMCIISFNQFKSLASMNPSDTKTFLDDVFGFKTFTEYNNAVVVEKKEKTNQQTTLQAVYDEACSNIEYFISQKEEKQKELSEQVDIDKVNAEISNLTSQMDKLKDDVEQQKTVKNERVEELRKNITSNNEKKSQYQLKINEYTILGKQEKEKYNLFKNGVCPTCGHEIPPSQIDGYKEKMMEYANLIKDINNKISLLDTDNASWNEKIADVENEFKEYRTSKLNDYSALDTKKREYDAEVIKYNNSLKIIGQNYDQMISDYTIKRDNTKKELDSYLIEIGEWNEMNDLFSKTLRYTLLNSLIPQINKSIQLFINKFEVFYNVEFDQEFKAHINAFGLDQEIKYNSLSTGQKKTLDIAIILGILQNIISSVDFNILFCDELFTNMDSNLRNIMLQVLNESNKKNRSIFIINHAEMADDEFSHKVRVSLVNKKISDKKGNTKVVRSSNYDVVF